MQQKNNNKPSQTKEGQCSGHYNSNSNSNNNDNNNSTNNWQPALLGEPDKGTKQCKRRAVENTTAENTRDRLSLRMTDSQTDIP